MPARGLFYLVSKREKAYNPGFVGTFAEAMAAACERARMLRAGVVVVHQPRGAPAIASRVVGYARFRRGGACEKLTGEKARRAV